MDKPQHDDLPETPGLEFSDKYSLEKAEQYHAKHSASLSRRWSDVREQAIARKALKIAGNPSSILDLPCGAGRFWPMLAEDPGRELFAADNSAGMVEVAGKAHPPAIRDRFKLFQTSAFAIDLPDNAVDCIFSMRLLHHVGEADDRMRLYHEYHRVARESVCLSLWVDGNYKAWRRKKLERDREAGKRTRKRHNSKTFQNRFVQPASLLEKEFRQAGFRIRGKVDFLPGYSMWRVYVLGKVTRGVGG